MVAPAVPNPRLGTYLINSVAGENVRAFVPPPLPPSPPLALGPELQDLIEKANRGLGRLDGVARIFSNPSLFLYQYVRKEALLSSQIEGTQSSLSDLLLFESDETPGVPVNDVEEVSHYVAAMNHALERLRGGFPVSPAADSRDRTRSCCRRGRGSHKSPASSGRRRTGSAVPAQATLPSCRRRRTRSWSAWVKLEKFLHDDPSRRRLLIKAALAHVQFETIHPFLDGNGRVGRLLITLLLCARTPWRSRCCISASTSRRTATRTMRCCNACERRAPGRPGCTSSCPE